MQEDTKEPYFHGGPDAVTHAEAGMPEPEQHKLQNNAINMAALMLVAEWQKQEKEHKYKIHRLRTLIRFLGAALAEAARGAKESDIITPPEQRIVTLD
jgi:hypothetical protein